MEKEDLVNAFCKKLDLFEKKFIENIDSRRKAEDKLWDLYYLKFYGMTAPYNPESETIYVPFNYEFYIKGHRCKIKQTLEIEILD